RTVWMKVARAGEIFPGEACVVRVGYAEFALYNISGRLFATGNRCPHQGGCLGDGYLEGKVICCPMHGWEFDVETGAANLPGQPGDEIDLCSDPEMRSRRRLLDRADDLLGAAPRVGGLDDVEIAFSVHHDPDVRVRAPQGLNLLQGEPLMHRAVAHPEDHARFL